MSVTSLIVPQKQAGGGQPSSHQSMNTVSNISASVLSYLKAIADGRRPLDADQLSEFNIFHSAQTPESTKDYCKLDLRKLLQYMTSSESNAMRPHEENDLSHPISSYFISSSHNTYLSGNQLYGDASTEAYRNVLLRGCRCIEIDVWDGEQKNSITGEEANRHFRPHVPHSISARLSRHHQGEEREEQDLQEIIEPAEDSRMMPTPWLSTTKSTRAEPRVLHGHTMTKEISFRAVCCTIRDSGFIASDLPLIVSLEIHCCADQQEIMVEIMKETWKEMLVEPLEAECKVLPSPRALRGKILVKVKGAAASVAAKVASLPTMQKVQSVSSPSESEDEISSSTSKEQTKSKKKTIIQALSNLGIYTHSYHFKTLSAPEAEVPTHVFSLSERKLADVHKSQASRLFSHNREFLMRVFPSGTRVSSSNLDPAWFWRRGVQMVALNWQSWDAGMMLNEGMFGGGDGWVVKPQGYRRSTSFDQTQIKSISQNTILYKTFDLCIEILSAQDLPLPQGDNRRSGFHPYVKCELHVEEAVDRSPTTSPNNGKNQDGKHKIITKPGRGSEANFGGEVIQFCGITGVVEELSFLRFKIQNDTFGKDDLAAWACIRLDRLRSGYRFVHLLDAIGVESPGVLLIKTTKRMR